MRQLLNISCSIIQMLIVVALAVLYRLSTTRMGVMRVLTHQSKNLEGILPQWLEALAVISLIAVFAFAVIRVVRGMVAVCPRWVLLAALAVVALAFLLLFSRQTLYIYYYLLLGTGIILVLQLVKCLLGQNKTHY